MGKKKISEMSKEEKLAFIKEMDEINERVWAVVENHEDALIRLKARELHEIIYRDILKVKKSLKGEEQ